MALSPHNPALFDPAVNHALHERFLKAVGNGTAPPRGSPLYDNLHNGYVRHEARINGGAAIAKAVPQRRSDAEAGDRPLPNGGLPYSGNPADEVDCSDVSTQDACLAIITATTNAVRRAIGADNLGGTGMAKARRELDDSDPALIKARLAAKIQYQTDAAFRAALGGPSPRRLATLSKVEEGLTKLAKSREVTVDDARAILEDLQGAQ